MGNGRVRFSLSVKTILQTIKVLDKRYKTKYQNEY